LTVFNPEKMLLKIDLLAVRWQDRVSKREVTERSGIRNINEEIKRRRWKYLGLVLRMEDDSIVERSVTGVPPGERRPGQPKRTWSLTPSCEIVALRENCVDRPESYDSFSAKSCVFLAQGLGYISPFPYTT
jgi:hypothetical protein